MAGHGFKKSFLKRSELFFILNTILNTVVGWLFIVLLWQNMKRLLKHLEKIWIWQYLSPETTNVYFIWVNKSIFINFIFFIELSYPLSCGWSPRPPYHNHQHHKIPNRHLQFHGCYRHICLTLKKTKGFSPYGKVVPVTRVRTCFNIALDLEWLNPIINFMVYWFS